MFDFAKLGNVNRKIESYLTDEVISIQNIDDLSWDGNFDTVIIGHLREISDIYRRDLLKNIIEYCIKYMYMGAITY